MANENNLPESDNGLSIIVGEGKIARSADGSNITIESNNMIRVAGNIKSLVDSTELPAGDEKYGDGTSFVLKAPIIKVLSTGVIRAGAGGESDLADTDIIKRKDGLAGGDGGSVVLEALEGITIESGATIEAGTGGKGERILEEVRENMGDITGGYGGKGGEIKMFVKDTIGNLMGRIVIDSGAHVRAGSGGRGGKVLSTPDDTSDDVVVVGGDGGDAGDVFLEAKTVIINSEEDIIAGEAGTGGNGEVRIGDKYAEAYGGEGGDGGAVIVTDENGKKAFNPTHGGDGGEGRVVRTDGGEVSSGGRGGADLNPKGQEGEDGKITTGGKGGVAGGNEKKKKTK